MDYAVIKPDEAWDQAIELTSFDDGNTKTNTLYWIGTRGKARNCPQKL